MQKINKKNNYNSININDFTTIYFFFNKTNFKQ